MNKSSMGKKTERTNRGVDKYVRIYVHLENAQLSNGTLHPRIHPSVKVTRYSQYGANQHGAT